MKYSQRSSESWVLEASNVFGVPLKMRTATEAAGPCPKCRDGEDRFIAFIEGNVWCRTCGYKGWWTEDKLEYSAIKKIEEEKKERRSKLFEQMHQCTLWETYNNDPDVEELWFKEGRMGFEEVARWGLGYCRSCPVSPEHGSLTIPVWYKGKLFDIRHRLLETDDETGKYRSHLPGISPLFFNVDCVIGARTLYIVEGEKKVIKTTGAGLESVIGYPGITHLGRLPNLLKRIGLPPKIVFIPDPKTGDKVHSIVRELPTDCYMVELWEKVDDFIDLYGKGAFQDALRIPSPL